ncbi:hypothetical protein NKG94_38520 [Micromonospora sp. M12]
MEEGTLDIVAPATADLGGGAPVASSPANSARSRSPTPGCGGRLLGRHGDGHGLPDRRRHPAETVEASLIDYWSGAATATTGTGTFTPGQATSAAAAPLDTVDPLTAFTHTGGTGGNTATWNPTLIVNVPLDSIAGVYTGR